MSLEKLAGISRFYGGNPEYVIAGGGNTSFKDEDFLYIKASGASLALAKPGDFVKMSRAGLAAVWQKDYPSDPDQREAAVLADMMASRCPGEEAKRPSVETLLHDLLPFAYVVHLHPALVNGLSCSQAGERAAAELFPGALWIPSINPGFILSRAVKDALDAATAKSRGNAPEDRRVIFLQNHGIFAAAHTTEEIDGIYRKVMETLGKQIKKSPDFGGETGTFGDSAALETEILKLARKIDPQAEWFVRFQRNNQIASFTASQTAFAPVSSAFTPDHIVYSGSDPLFISDPAGLEAKFRAHMERTRRIPRIIAVEALGIFGLANSEKALGNALELFRDTQKVAVYSESFGGPRFMSEDQIRFINNWEVERYRSKVSA